MSLFFLLLLLAQPNLPGEATAERSNVLPEDYAACGVVSLYLVCQIRGMPVAWEQIKQSVGPPDVDDSHSFEQLSRAA